MAVESKDKVITVELLGSVADAIKEYVDDSVEDLPTSEDLLEAATSADVASIISKFSVES